MTFFTAHVLAASLLLTWVTAADVGRRGRHAGAAPAPTAAPGAGNCSARSNATCAGGDCFRCANTYSAQCCDRGGGGGGAAKADACCRSVMPGEVHCYNSEGAQCCLGYDAVTAFVCPKHAACCGANNDESRCCDTAAGETCCNAQYSARCCPRGWTCCPFPNFHFAPCCSPDQLCCGTYSGGGECCDKATQVCGTDGIGCKPK